jgi:hypothetical protein
MQPTNVPAENESDLVVAIFRACFILFVAFSPILMPQTMPTSLQIVLAVAGVYNVGLLIAYSRGLSFPYRRQITIFLDLLMVTLWIATSGVKGMAFFPLYYITVIIGGFWFGVSGTLTCAALAGLFYLSAVFSFTQQQHDPQLLAIALREQIPFLFLVTLVVSYVAGIQAKERQGWYEARIFLARHQERIRLAQKVAEFIQPGELPVLPKLDLGVRIRPAGHSGAGDFYEIITFAEDKVGIAVADVAGKHEPGLVKLPLFKSALRICARSADTPATMLSELNRLLVPELEPEMFISLSYIMFDLKAMTLSCAVAGQEPPFLLRNREAIEIPAAGLVLGVMPGIIYEQQEMPVQPGDSVVLFTDGSFGGARPKWGRIHLSKAARDGALGQRRRPLGPGPCQPSHGTAV